MAETSDGGNGQGVVRVLVVRSWSYPIAPLRAALHAVGVRARFIRIDIEPALVAALGRRNFDVIAHDATTPGVPRDLLDGHLRDLAIKVPVVDIGRHDTPRDIAARVVAAQVAAQH
jgi:hypothetical protein